MKVRKSKAIIEAMEARRLLTVSGFWSENLTFEAVPGQAFTGRIGIMGFKPEAPTSLTIDWGDGTPETQASVVPINEGASAQWAIEATHTYAKAGTYSIFDASNGPDFESFMSTADVGIQPPNVTSIFATSATQFSGTVAVIPALTTAPQSVTIDWGDNSTPSAGTYTLLGNGQAAITGSHTYSTPGNYAINALDEDGLISLSSAIVSAASSDTANVFDASSGNSFSGNIALIPALATAPQSVSIDWGDGSSPSDGTYTLLGNGQAVISASHTYAAAGNYAVNISDVDSTGATSAIGQSTAVVVPVDSYNSGNFVAQFLKDNPGNNLAFDGQIGQTVTVPFPISAATIDWGDGTQSPASFTSAQNGSEWNITFLGSHTYTAFASAGYSVAVTPQTDSLPDPAPVVVSQGQVVEPNLTVGATAGEVSGAVIACFRVPLATAPTSVMIDWGDGTPASAGWYTVDTGETAYPDAIELAAGDVAIEGSHAYAAPGTYTITITGVEGSNPTPTILAASLAGVSAPPVGTTGATVVGTLILNGTSNTYAASPAATSGGTETPAVTASNTSTETPATTSQTGKLTLNATGPGAGSITSAPASVLNLNKSDKELDVLTVNPAASVTPATAGVAGLSLNEAWTAPASLTAAPKVIIHWGDGTTSTYQFTSASQLTAASSTQWVEDSHTYRKHGKYHAVAVFKENGKIIDRVTDVLTIAKSSG